MKTALLSLCLLSTVAFAQTEKIVVDHAETDKIAQRLDLESQSSQNDHKTRRQLKVLAEAFREQKEEIVLEVKRLDECENCQGKSKEQIVLRNIGRKLGRGSAWLTTATGKPFMLTAGFLTGVFEKKEKNQDIIALYKFFLNHSKEFDKLYLEAGAPEEMVELMLGEMQSILEAKTRIILKDFLVHLGIKRELPENLADFELTEAEMSSIDMSKVTPDFVNNHPEYKELKPIIGEVSKQDVEDIIISGYFEKSITFDNYMAALPKIHEAAITVVTQIFVPKMVLGVLSSSLAGIYAVPVIAADIGTAISAGVCLQKSTQEKFKEDKDLRSFCSYVVNRSSYQLMKSRAKGYIAGKNLRAKIEASIKKAKEKRAERRKKRQEARAKAELG